MPWHEYSYYAEVVVWHAALIKDTARLNAKANALEELYQNKKEDLNICEKRILNKNDEVASFQAENLRLVGALNKSEKKVGLWKNVTLILGSVSAVLFGIIIIQK